MKRKFICFIMLIVSLVAVRFLTVEQVSGEENGESLESIFTEFYNEGVYVKDTVIYVDNTKVEGEIAQYFHAQKPSYQRTTYYNGDKLWFSYGSGYGTSEDGHLTQFKMVDGVVTKETVNKSLPGMEEYYCTLNDFVLGEHQSAHTDNVKVNLAEGWTNENGVYTSSASGVLEGFRLFVAPTWVGKTSETANYIDFTKATVEKAGQALIMKLWVSSTEIEGKLVNNTEVNGLDAVFAKAVIVKDTAVNKVVNGGFENGSLEGWTKVGQIGAVTSESNYWVWEDGGYSFNKDGEYLFSSYADDNEKALGSLTSSKFVVGGTGWITFKIGGSKNISLMNVQVVDANTGDILKTFGNTAWVENIDGVKAGCSMFAYKANISDLLGKEVYIRVVDNARFDYGCVFFDSLNTYYTTIPGDEFIYAEDLGFGGNIYQVFNGDFERDNLDGWVREGNIGDISRSESDWFGSFGKEVADEPFFSCYVGGQSEGNRGYLQSSTFVLGGNGWITFMLGGAKNHSQMNILVIDANTQEVVKVLGRNEITYGDWCVLLKHKVDLSEFIGRTLYLRFVDDADGDYGLFFIDKLDTHHTTIPSDEYKVAYDLTNLRNGSFEQGLAGWKQQGNFAKVSNLNGYWGSNIAYEKVGDWLFTGLEGQHWETDPNLEGDHGTLKSHTFVLDAHSVVTFKLGAAKNANTGIRFVNAETGEIMASFHNTEFGRHGNEGRLMQYVYQFNNESSVLCYVEIFDFASSDWGLVAVDNIVCNTEWISGDWIFVAVNDIH